MVAESSSIHLPLLSSQETRRTVWYFISRAEINVRLPGFYKPTRPNHSHLINLK